MRGSRKAYAAHRGVCLKAVQKALALGKILVGEDDKIDFDEADQMWGSNSLSRSGSANNRPLAAPRKEKSHDHRSSAPAGYREGSYVDAKTRRERAEAERAELRLASEKGKLLPAEDVKRAFGALGRSFGSSLESFATQMAPRLVGSTDLASIEKLLRDELRAMRTRVCDEIVDRFGSVAVDADTNAENTEEIGFDGDDGDDSDL